MFRLVLPGNHGIGETVDNLIFFLPICINIIYYLFNTFNIREKVLLFKMDYGRICFCLALQMNLGWIYLSMNLGKKKRKAKIVKGVLRSAYMGSQKGRQWREVCQSSLEKKKASVHQVYMWSWQAESGIAINPHIIFSKSNATNLKVKFILKYWFVYENICWNTDICGSGN